MIRQDLIDYFWPFYQMGAHDLSDIPTHLHESTRMRNRWQLPRLLPFIIRWWVLFSLFGLSQYLVSLTPNTLLKLLLGVSFFTGWFSVL